MARCVLTLFLPPYLSFCWPDYFTYAQFERGEALENIGKDVEKVFEEEGDQESLSILPKAVDTVRKKVISEN